LDLEKFLPQEYAKDKSVEKKIFNEHRKNIPLTAHNAKYRYVQLCRALKTYGTTFFLVKEYMKVVIIIFVALRDAPSPDLQGKQKLVPVLLGVNRDSIMKADQETKRILVTWKLPQVLRWASGPNHFTLDFGDDRPRYTVQTTEGYGTFLAGAGRVAISPHSRPLESLSRSCFTGTSNSTWAKSSRRPMPCPKTRLLASPASSR
jgi:talin